MRMGSKKSSLSQFIHRNSIKPANDGGNLFNLFDRAASLTPRNDGNVTSICVTLNRIDFKTLSIILNVIHSEICGEHRK